jgi:hypothetical protein
MTKGRIVVPWKVVLNLGDEKRLGPATHSL